MDFSITRKNWQGNPGDLNIRKQVLIKTVGDEIPDAQTDFPRVIPRRARSWRGKRQALPVSACAPCKGNPGADRANLHLQADEAELPGGGFR